MSLALRDGALNNPQNTVSNQPPVLILGTAQLGLVYGIANTTGKPDQHTANALVATAWEQGVSTFDTAQGYGDSETVLGQAFLACRVGQRARVITKLSPTLPASGSEIADSLSASRDRLRVEHLFCVMLHREEQLPLLDDYVGEVLCNQRAAGLVEHLGISVYTPQKALQALRHPLLDIVQIPASLVDRRCEAAGVFAMAKNMNKQLHVRSAFLQGTLLLPPQRIPEALRELRPVVEKFQQISAAAGIQPSLAALLWLHHRYPEAAILFGAETPEQVRDNLNPAIWKQGPSPAFIRQMEAIVPPQKAELLNPSLWKR